MTPCIAIPMMIATFTLLIAQVDSQTRWIFQSGASVLLVMALLSLRWVLRRAINQQHPLSVDLRRRWLLQVRNLTFVLIALGLVVIWSAELKTAALSVVAFVVALVLATKELILCLSGGFLKLSSRMFVLGDVIEVGTVRGEVIDQTLLTTKLLEHSTGPNGTQFTGRTITLPNMVFLTQPVSNETLTPTFGLHPFTIPIKAESDWSVHEAALLESLQAVCEPYLEQARAAVQAMSQQEGLSSPQVEPRVQLSLPEPGRVNLVARLPYPSDRKTQVVQQAMRGYLQRVAAIEAKHAEEARKDTSEKDVADLAED